MKFNIKRSVLLQPLLFVSSVIERRQTLPILSNIFFKVEDNKLFLIGSDLEVEITQSIDKVYCENGSFTAFGKTVTDIVRMLPENSEITFHYKNPELLIESGKSRYKLQTLPADDYPRIKADEWNERFKVEAKKLKETLDKVSFAMAIHDARFSLNGVSFIVEKNELTMTATDGHRLARSKTMLEVDTENKIEVIVPRKAVFEISKIFDNETSVESQSKENALEFVDQSMLTLEYSQNHVRISAPGQVLISKLIDGKYPKFDDLVKVSDDVVKLNLDRQFLTDMLSRVSVVMAESRFKGVKFMLTENKLKISANTPEQQQASEEMTIDYSGDEMTYGYNVVYLLEACRAIKTKKVDIVIDNKDNICFFKQPKDKHSLWLVMPMRL